MNPTVSCLVNRMAARALGAALGLFFLDVLVEARAADVTPAAGLGLEVDGAALMRAWVPPVYPEAALKARRSGMVTLRLIIDGNGELTAARAMEDSDDEFVESALAAVREWEFSPALERGKPVASCVETLVIFSPALGQQKSRNRVPPEDLKLRPAPRSSPQAKATPGGEYPALLVERQLNGVVRFACTVSTDGRVLRPRIIAASHADFVVPALRALEQWEFTPGKEGDLAIAAPVEAEITFDTIVGNREAVLAVNGITTPEGAPPEITPEPRFMVDAVWPLELLLKGEGGSAVAAFTVRANGSVTEVRLLEASQPEFGHALIAALESSAFSRPMKNGRTTSVALAKRTEFKAVPLDAAEDTDPIARLVLALRAGEVGGAKGLDGKLVPRYRVAPSYPAALKENGRPAGRAEIDFVIDREGRARLPRIASATHEEFGWAAATAIAQWVFQAPTRDGEPVDVKVRMPFDFAPPAE